MAMGSYGLGAEVRIVLQGTEGAIAETSNINAKVTMIVKPDKTSVGGFPKSMSILDQDYGTYFLDYTPDQSGDYIVIMNYTIEEQEYTALENFTVSGFTYVPRAEAR